MGDIYIFEELLFLILYSNFVSQERGEVGGICQGCLNGDVVDLCRQDLHQVFVGDEVVPRWGAVLPTQRVEQFEASSHLVMLVTDDSRLLKCVTNTLNKCYYMLAILILIPWSFWYKSIPAGLLVYITYTIYQYTCLMGNFRYLRPKCQ